ncbi:MAG: beta-glucosidase BglX [Bacteroidales bacterium]|nr:beta-glucosidase BglX [Bacteroidales bacterium]
MNNRSINFVVLLLVFAFCASSPLIRAAKPISPKSIEQRIDSLMALMTLDEKIGQMNQYASSWATGPVSLGGNKMQEIKDGKVGSLLNVKGVEKTKAMQKIAMQSRLKIPLLFGLDVIHGYKTTFPIPLAEVASWDMDAIQMGARIAAIEASSAGVHWTFAPMVDIARDPRWGRVMEGAGEDTYLGCAVAKARVKGFQGDNLGNTNAVMACAKHFAAYGAAIGGRDYNSVDMSLRTLWEVYLPPFKAAVDAGAATFMNSFNDLNGVPASGSSYLQRDILKGKWNFQGFVVSDWGSIGEMVQHGFVADDQEAAFAASTAGSDMDMESRCYTKNLAKLVTDGKVDVRVVDEAVRRILRKKFELGLFEDPYRFSNEKREKQELSNPLHRTAARDMAKKSIVLLKNENELLPLNIHQKIALIGPLAKSKEDMLGFWNVRWDDNSDVVTPFEALEGRVGKGNLLYAKGCEVLDTTRTGFAEAIEMAKKADVVVLSIGEKRDMSGEAKSRSNIHLPGVQEELVKAICATGKPVVVLISAGRPLVFNWTADHANAILYTWWLGSEAGNAIADVLFGDYNPSAKLPMTFPQSEGQIPVYYNYMNTGRPAKDDATEIYYRSGYIDLSKRPKYPFGFGLSYTKFAYSELILSDSTMNEDGRIEVSVVVTNVGERKGEEVVQLYLRDRVASLVRPVKELKGFQKISLLAGESKAVRFAINKEKLSFYNANLEWRPEPGMFDVMIGSSSQDIRLRSHFELTK